MLGDARLKISGSIFLENKAYLKGGAISADSYGEFTVTGNSMFKDNTVKMQAGDAIQLANTVQGSVLIENSVL